MQQERRRTSRRDGDEFLNQTLVTLQNIEKIVRGEHSDYGEHYAHLMRIKEKVGRRHEDHELGEMLCSTIESIASNLDTLLNPHKPLRQVKITKVSGRRGARLRSYTSIEGWEAEQPRVGECYLVYTYDASVFRSSEIIEVKADYFQTQNSLYRIQLLNN